MSDELEVEIHELDLICVDWVAEDGEEVTTIGIFLQEEEDGSILMTNSVAKRNPVGGLFYVDKDLITSVEVMSSYYEDEPEKLH